MTRTNRGRPFEEWYGHGDVLDLRWSVAEGESIRKGAEVTVSIRPRWAWLAKHFVRVKLSVQEFEETVEVIREMPQPLPQEPEIVVRMRRHRHDA